MEGGREGGREGEGEGEGGGGGERKGERKREGGKEGGLLGKRGRDGGGRRQEVIQQATHLVSLCQFLLQQQTL